MWSKNGDLQAQLTNQLINLLGAQEAQIKGSRNGEKHRAGEVFVAFMVKGQHNSQNQ